MLRSTKMAALVLLVACAGQAKATLITVTTSNASAWSVSTIHPAFNTDPWPGLTEAFIAGTAGTYTQAAVVGGNGPTSFPGAGPLAAGSLITMFRTTFALPAFGTLTADVQALADNNPQIFVNGHQLAIYGTDQGGFGRTPFRLFVDSAGNVTNGYLGGSLFSSVTNPFPSTNWISGGTNELIVAVRNLPSDAGGLSLLATIETQQLQAVPEPTTVALGLIGTLGGICYSRSRRRKRSA